MLAGHDRAESGQAQDGCLSQRGRPSRLWPKFFHLAIMPNTIFFGGPRHSLPRRGRPGGREVALLVSCRAHSQVILLRTLTPEQTLRSAQLYAETLFPVRKLLIANRIRRPTQLRYPGDLNCLHSGAD